MPRGKSEFGMIFSPSWNYKNIKMKNENKTTSSRDIAESTNDKKHLQADTARLDLPDVEDIPGQQHVHPPIMNEYADTTVSSDDEEGVDILDDEDEDIVEENGDDDDDDDDNDDENSDDTVTPVEKKILETSAEETPGDEEAEDRRRMALDNVDEDGEPLEEEDLLSDWDGEDLDLPEEEETTEEETE
jgi:hypothetical protein